MQRRASRCRIVWRDVETREIVHVADTDTTSAMLYKRWIRDGVMEGYTLDVFPPDTEVEE